MDAIKTGYAIAFERLILLLKTGAIGDIVSVDVTCTSLKNRREIDENGIRQWGSLYSWGPYALLAVFSILGINYVSKDIQTKRLGEDTKYDLFTKINFLYDKAVASIKVGNGVKSEGELVISGTEGYVYVPAPWWKTEYFEVRYENTQNNKRYFYQLDGEGIRYMLVNLIKAINGGKNNNVIPLEISNSICKVLEDYNNDINVTRI